MESRIKELLDRRAILWDAQAEAKNELEAYNRILTEKKKQLADIQSEMEACEVTAGTLMASNGIKELTIDGRTVAPKKLPDILEETGEEIDPDYMVEKITRAIKLDITTAKKDMAQGVVINGLRLINNRYTINFKTVR